MMTKRGLPVLAGLSILVLALFPGCNIFSWSDSPEAEQDLLADAQDFMEEGDFLAAKEVYEEILLTEPLFSDALYGHAKASLLLSGESIITIVREVSKAEEIQKAGASLPFLGKPEADQNRIYQVNLVILKDLEPIFAGDSYGSYDSSDVTIDLLIANTVVGMLRFADTNADEEIKSPPDVNLNIFRAADSYTIEGIDSMAADPDLINGMITNIGIVLESNSEILLAMIGDTTQIDTDTIDELLGTITESAGWYYVNTGVPGNPGIGDNDGDGVADEECLDGIDEDGDGLVDEDAEAPGVGHCPPS